MSYASESLGNTDQGEYYSEVRSDDQRVCLVVGHTEDGSEATAMLSPAEALELARELMLAAQAALGLAA